MRAFAVNLVEVGMGVGLTGVGITLEGDNVGNDVGVALSTFNVGFASGVALATNSAVGSFVGSRGGSLSPQPASNRISTAIQQTPNL